MQYTNSRGINIGKIRASCDGYMTFGNNESKEFKFNEKKKEIVWNGPDAEDKWIQGYFYEIITNLFMCFEWGSRAT